MADPKTLNTSNWALFFARIAAGLPAAIETAELMGQLLRPGQKSGPQKLAAVKAALDGGTLGASIINPAAGVTAEAVDAAVTGIIDATVALKKACSGPAPAPAAPAPAPAVAAPPLPPAAVVASQPPTLAEMTAAGNVAAHGEVREYGGVRLVYDAVSDHWNQPGR